MDKAISLNTLQRLPSYLTFLHSILENEQLNVSAKQVADALGLGEIQVRKDLASVSSGGRPKVGYVTRELISDIETFLGYHEINDAVIVGVGNLGRALLSYGGFKDYGLNIVAAFDHNKSVIGAEISGHTVLSTDELSSICKKKKIRIGIITVPAKHAQSVCDRMVESGILAIWNFAPTMLKAPPHILVKNENMAASLAVLSKHLSENLNKTSPV